MLDIKYIRDNLEAIKKAVIDKRVDVSIDDLIVFR